MPTCLLAQATFLPDVLNAKGVIPATVFVLAPVASQPPNVSLQSCAYVLVDGVSAAAIQQAAVPFDYALASAFWVFAFSTTIAFWFLAKNLDLIISAIKRG
jgi:hypothetical protein